MRGAALMLLAAVNCAAQSLPDFAGVWVQRWQGQVFRVLTLRMEGATLAGSAAQPRRFTLDQDGVFSKISAEHSNFPLQQIVLAATRLELSFDDDRYAMTLVNGDHAMLLPLEDGYPLPPFEMERSKDASVGVARSWPTVRYPAEIVALQKKLKAMVKVDQKVRMAPKVSFAEMEKVDRRHLAEVLRIHAKYGWPRISVVGREASHDYWLLVQHQDLEVQQMVLPDLEKAAASGEASKSNFAYLWDRVQVRLGKAQRWGTQVSCKQGKVVLDAIEDPERLDQRRKELNLMPIEKYLKVDYLVRTCAAQ
jgi:hypothetical protein